MCRNIVFKDNGDICPNCLRSGQKVRMQPIPAMNGQHPYIVKHPERVQAEVMAELRAEQQ